VIPLVLRSDAVALSGFGGLLLLAPWDELYGRLGVPRGEPELWTQAAGLLLVSLAYLLWIAPRDARLTQGVAFAAAIANLGGMLAGNVDAGGIEIDQETRWDINGQPNRTGAPGSDPLNSKEHQRAQYHARRRGGPGGPADSTPPRQTGRPG